MMEMEQVEAKEEKREKRESNVVRFPGHEIEAVLYDRVKTTVTLDDGADLPCTRYTTSHICEDGQGKLLPDDEAILEETIEVALSRSVRVVVVLRNGCIHRVVGRMKKGD